MARGRSFFGATAKVVRRSAARVAARAAQLVDVGRDALPGRSRHVVRLDDVRRRLELLVTAVYDHPIPIVTAVEPKRRPLSMWERLRGPRHLRQHEVLPSTDGERIHLPRELDAADVESAIASYRLLAIQQAERIARGTPEHVDADMAPLVRDLYLVRESAEVDAAIARNVPGLRTALAAARGMALAARPPLPGLTAIERGVEALLQRFLSGDTPASLTSASVPAPSADPSTLTPADSLAWARSQADAMASLGGRYRGIAPVFAWGAVKGRRRERNLAALPQAYSPPTLQGGKYGFGRIGRGTGKGGHQTSDTGQEEGTTDERRGESVLDPSAKQKTADGPGAKPSTDQTADTVESESEGEDTTELVNSPTDARSPSRSREIRHARRRIPVPQVVGESIEYAEWDWQAGDYRARGAVVHQRAPDVSDDSWGNAVLAKHGPLVRRLRERFERLRARRARLNQQRDGDELDLAACVRAMVDQRAGQPPDDRLYQTIRPARRGLAICLLIDISGSTDEWIDARRRVIDVEKVALLLASEALDALGDAYAILTFSGKGRANVRMRTIKAFDETNSALVRRRMAALEPEGYTRAGAAIRHAAALLEQQPAAHRLLLILSDGKPNDVDDYEGLNGVEDTRQAIQEARAQGVYPFCLTIDRQGQQYLSRIFGEAGHTVLRNPSQLPMALVKVVKHLLA